jgi:4'-phosphopantetheinyl transferase
MGEVEITDPKQLLCSADDDVRDKPVQGCYITPMAGSSLDADTVRVRWLSLEADDALHLPRWQSMLGSDEAARAEHFHFARDRHVFIAAHALVRAMLSEATGLPTAVWRYVNGPFGKPAIAPECADGRLSFNISHTHGMAACAVARDQELGLDVEASDRPTKIAIADRFFAPEEARIVHQTLPEQRRDLFFRFWTLKEAFIKATGEGLSRPLGSFSFALDPIRVAFHPGDDKVTAADDPTKWQFLQCRPAPHRLLALALRRPHSRTLHVDARAIGPDEVTLG